MNCFLSLVGVIVILKELSQTLETLSVEKEPEMTFLGELQVLVPVTLQL